MVVASRSECGRFVTKINFILNLGGLILNLGGLILNLGGLILNLGGLILNFCGFWGWRRGLLRAKP